MNIREAPPEFKRYIFDDGFQWLLSREAYHELSGEELEQVRRELRHKYGIHAVHDSIAISHLMDRIRELERRVDFVEENNGKK